MNSNSLLPTTIIQRQKDFNNQQGAELVQKKNDIDDYLNSPFIKDRIIHTYELYFKQVLVPSAIQTNKFFVLLPITIQGYVTPFIEINPELNALALAGINRMVSDHFASLGFQVDSSKPSELRISWD